MYFECIILIVYRIDFGQAETVLKTRYKTFGEKWRIGTFFKIKLNEN